MLPAIDVRRAIASAVSFAFSGNPSAVALQVPADGRRTASSAAFGLRALPRRLSARSSARFCAVVKLGQACPRASTTAVPSMVGLPTGPFGSFTPCTPP